ncbi:2-dehydro-3-deoxyphosphooctonate aldolase [Candidatus Kinetoplastibacterium sorsogonicusi]|uniref:3-deoxy-8-phosphooctulonate synthase n=1 Tax=Candidatus Kinetoplastidibacterium kentomonadis TaxID=1576550 RepID=A0A3S7JA54_9PROT|nr:3-deoxy-8-phosphooctulonate synthase [Candidatus Kinetoplastibacterium sorsogonicusi]AWD32544.1 2-dehydro-3-deoxyphosphooctonate aldolase [Candidatus Kinetoplastibacterium sorsogonicusi]
MKIHNFEINNLLTPLFLISGPSTVDSKNLIFDTANYLQEITNKLHINLLFKCSFNKDNNISNNSFRCLELDKGLETLYEVKNKLNIPIITDVNNLSQIDLFSSIVDVLQIPEFLCKQIDFISKCVSTLKPINITKGQFLSPYEMKLIVDKARSISISSGGDGKNIMICDSSAICCGYNNIVSDIRSIMIMRENNCPIIFDANYLLPINNFNTNILSLSKNIEFVSALSRSAVATGISGICIETDIRTKTDSLNFMPLSSMETLLESLLEIDYLVKNKFL